MKTKINYMYGDISFVIKPDEGIDPDLFEDFCRKSDGRGSLCECIIKEGSLIVRIKK